MENINLEHDGNLKTLNIDIDTIPSDDNNKLSFSKNDNSTNNHNGSQVKFSTSNDSPKPNLSSFDRKDIQIGLDLLENPNKKKKVSSDGDITFSPKSSDVIGNINFKNDNYNNTNNENLDFKTEDIKEFKISDNSEVNKETTFKLDDNKNDGIDVVKIDSDVNIDDIFKDISKQDNDIKSISIENLVSNSDKPKENEDIVHNVPTEQFIPRRKTPEEILQEKKDYLFKFDRLIEKGYNIHKRFTLASDLDEMAYEYNKIKNSKELDNSIKFQRQMLMACITGVEWMNNKFDPFDVKLDGWSESVNENINDYDEVFEELHEKYKDKASVPPEIKLLFMLGGSAFMFHLSKTLFKTSLPGMEQIMQQNPELMKQFASAAMNSMSNQNPGFTNFMGSMGGIPQQQPGMMNQMPQQQNMMNQMPQQQNMMNQMPQQQNMMNQMPQQQNMMNQMPAPGMMHSQPSPEEMYKNQTNSFNARKEMSGPSGVDDILSKLSSNSEVREVDNLPDLNNSEGIKGNDIKRQINNSGISINL